MELIVDPSDLQAAAPDDARYWMVPTDLWPEGWDDPWAVSGDDTQDDGQPFPYPAGLP